MIKDKLAFVGNSTSDAIPVRLQGWYKHPAVTEDMLKAVTDVIKTSVMSGYRGTPEGHAGGKKVQELCEFFKKYLGVKHAIAFNSATSALHASLVACGLHMGDYVIVSPYTFSSSASCALMANCIPVFADIDEDTFNITAGTIEVAMKDRAIKAVIPVHLAGQSCDMDDIMALAKLYNLRVIEDSAQTLGGTYNGKMCGTIGDVGVFSFNQSKPVTTGEGGMAVTNDEKIAARLKAVMNHGEVSDPDIGVVGYNYRMTEMVAALALEQMKQLDRMNDVRIDLNSYLARRLTFTDGITPPLAKPYNRHVYYTTMMKYDARKMGMSREAFQKAMMQEGIYFGSGYVTPLYLYPIYQKRIPDIYRLVGKNVDYSPGICPIAERMWREEIMVTDILRFPAAYKDVDDIVQAIHKVKKHG